MSDVGDYLATKLEESSLTFERDDHVAEGRYTAPGYEDAQDRVATEYHRRLAELEKELAE